VAGSVDITELRRKVESGSGVARSVLGGRYLDGIEVEADYQEAFRLLSAAAHQGASRAVVNRAGMHSEGLRVGKDGKDAVRLYKSVSSSEFPALIAFGRLSSRGVEVPVDSAEAPRW